MDLVTHVAFASGIGAITGLDPLACAVGSVLPDLVQFRRQPEPSYAYKLSHSAITPFVLACLMPFEAFPWAVLSLTVGYYSHLWLDLFTHGPAYAPRLLYPLSERRWKRWSEWEWFNRSWVSGLLVTAITLVVILAIATGSH